MILENCENIVDLISDPNHVTNWYDQLLQGNGNSNLEADGYDLRSI